MIQCKKKTWQTPQLILIDTDEIKSGGGMFGLEANFTVNHLNYTTSHGSVTNFTNLDAYNKAIHS